VGGRCSSDSQESGRLVLVGGAVPFQTISSGVRWEGVPSHEVIYEPLGVSVATGFREASLGNEHVNVACFCGIQGEVSELRGGVCAHGEADTLVANCTILCHEEGVVHHKSHMVQDILNGQGQTVATGA